LKAKTNPRALPVKNEPAKKPFQGYRQKELSPGKSNHPLQVTFSQ